MASLDRKLNESPLFIKPLEPVTDVVDCPAKLECKISGEPFPDIKWTKDRKEIADDDPNVRKHQFSNGEVALIFDKCKPENTGKYVCTATNKNGEKSSEAPLKVIKATISGNPLPDIHWYLDDQPVSCSDTILPSFDGKKASLTVYRCNPWHEGVYECKVSYILGEASSKAKVSVKANKAPNFIERLSYAQFVAKEPMKLICLVEGIPEPNVEWYFNMEKLTPGVKYSILKEGDKCILAVPHPRNSDSGIYEC